MIPQDSTAPGFNPDAVGLPWYRRAMAQGAGYFLPSSGFAAIPVVFQWAEPLPIVITVAGLCLITAVMFVGSSLVMHWSETRRWLWLAGLTTTIVAVAWVTDDLSVPAYFTAYITAAAAALLPWAETRILIPAVALVALGLVTLDGKMFAAIMAITGLALGLSIGLGLENERTRAALQRAEQRTAVLAVAAERERIGRDLHDILGHSLTAIAVKADLARALVQRDPERAEAEVAELAGIARHALADVRATAANIRNVRLATEIASARSVLQAAGIECDAPTAVPPSTDAASQAFGYAVREGVTNVVRHSGATRCVIEVGPQSVTVSDDGSGLPPEAGGGTGLAGLRQRFEDLGGWVELASDGRGTVLTASLGVAE